jgi:hypothetical protein
MSSQKLSPARLEAFSDGVIAVIITIMVLELKVPALDGMAGLRAVAPTVFLYLLSFAQVDYRPMASLALIALVGAIWLLPPRVEPLADGGSNRLDARPANSTTRKG